MKGKGSSCCNKTGNNATVTNDLEDMKQQMDMIQKIVVNQERVNKVRIIDI